jgi:hypothetical protein
VGYDDARRKRNAKLHLVVYKLDHPVALHIICADADDRVQLGRPAEAVQEATGHSARLMSQGPRRPDANKGFGLLPRCPGGVLAAVPAGSGSWRAGCGDLPPN